MGKKGLPDCFPETKAKPSQPLPGQDSLPGPSLTGQENHQVEAPFSDMLGVLRVVTMSSISSHMEMFFANSRGQAKGLAQVAVHLV